MKVAFIGLGIMGSRMAINLIKAGNQVLVWNRSREKADALLSLGAMVAPSLKDAVKDVDVFITMLPTPEVIETIASENEGILKNAKKNALWINTSTINPSFAEQIAAKANEAGLRYLDAPVSGSKIPAEKGELIFLIGGENKDLEEARPLLSAMGKTINHLGKIGNGSKMKLVVNSILGQSMLAISEGISLGVASGLDQNEIINILLAGPAYSRLLEMKKDKIESSNFDPEVSLRIVHKDFHLILKTAYENNMSMPLAAITKEVYGMAKQSRGEDDISAIYDYLVNKNK